MREERGERGETPSRPVVGAGEGEGPPHAAHRGSGQTAEGGVAGGRGVPTAPVGNKVRVRARCRGERPATAERGPGPTGVRRAEKSSSRGDASAAWPLLPPSASTPSPSSPSPSPSSRTAADGCGALDNDDVVVEEERVNTTSRLVAPEGDDGDGDGNDGDGDDGDSDDDGSSATRRARGPRGERRGVARPPSCAPPGSPSPPRFLGSRREGENGPWPGDAGLKGGEKRAARVLAPSPPPPRPPFPPGWQRGLGPAASEPGPRGAS